MQKAMIFCPMKAEAKLIASFLPNSKRSSFGYTFNFGQIVVSGKPGKEAMLDAISKNFKKCYIPILFGLAGSLVNDIYIGDIFVASSVSSIEDQLDDQLEQQLVDLPCIAGSSFKNSKFFTSDIPILTVDKRKECKEIHNCKLVEMEGYYFIKYFQDHEINSYMIRIVGDTPDVDFRMPFSNDIRIGTKKVAEEIITFIKNK